MNFRSLVPFASTHRGVVGQTAYEDPFLSLHRDMSRLVDEVFRGFGLPSTRANGAVLAPRIDVTETDRDIEIAAELPGVADNDVEVSLSDGVLTIKGEKKTKKEDQDKGYHLMERSYDSFLRSLAIPYDVDPDKVSASFEDGVLKVTLPKPPAAQSKTKKIALKKAR